jgi:hypothetical protein
MGLLAVRFARLGHFLLPLEYYAHLTQSPLPVALGTHQLDLPWQRTLRQNPSEPSVAWRKDISQRFGLQLRHCVCRLI